MPLIACKTRSIYWLIWGVVEWNRHGLKREVSELPSESQELSK